MNCHADAPRRARCAGFGARWRSFIAVYVLAAVAWPSLGPLPWVAMLPVHAAAAAAVHADDDHRHAHHDDASDIPGSPTHPADHDCAQCEVLKHLARCAPAPFAVPTIALQPPAAVLPAIVDEGKRSNQLELLPPVRGPPSAVA